MSKHNWDARSFREGDFEKAAHLRKLFNEDNSDKRSGEAKYYHWKMLTNPIQKGVFNVADDHGDVVGLTTITPKSIWIRGSENIGAEIGDTFTDRRYQRQGIFTTLVDMSRESAIQSGISFLYGTPNNQSLPGYLAKCNFLPLQKVFVDSLIYPLNPQKILTGKMQHPLFSKLLGLIISKTYGVIYPIPSKKESEDDITLVDEFPESISDAWIKSCVNYDWVLNRTKTYLDWRFFKNPDDYSVSISWENKIPSGYLVSKLGTWGNLTVGYVADFMVYNYKKRTFRNLLANAFKYFRDANCDMVATWAVRDSEHHKTLKKMGFIRYKNVPIICYANELGKKVSINPGRWHFTMADSDNI